MNNVKNILSKIHSAETAAELIKLVFDYFVSLHPFINISFFVMDNKSFEFVFYQSAKEGKSIESIDCFNYLIENGSIAKTLEADVIFEVKNIPCAAHNNSVCYLKPLTTKNEALGMFLFVSEEEITNKSIIDNIDLISNFFTLILKNLELIKDFERLKENQEEILFNRTTELVKGTKELKIIIDYLHIGIFITEKNSGEIQDANLMAQNIVGLSKEEIIGKKRNDFFLFIDSNSIFQVSSTSEGMMKIKNEDIIPVIHKATTILLNNEEFILDNFLDISERKKMEVELQQAHDDLENKVIARTLELQQANKELQIQIEERIVLERERMKLYLAAQQSPTIIFMTDFNGNIVYTNPSFQKTTGYSQEEVIGKTPRILKSNYLTAADYKLLWKTISSGKSWSKEFKNRKKNGEYYWVIATISPIRDESGEIINYLAIQEDITVKKQYELDLIIAKEKAETSVKFKTALLNNMSHEFRTPLISIIGYSELLADEVSQENKEILKSINIAGNRLLNTLNNVLILSQMDSIDDAIIIQAMNVDEKIKLLLPKYLAQAEEKGLSFHYETSGEDLTLYCDHSFFSHMLNCLVDNAIKFTNHGSVKINCLTKLIKTKNYLAIEVIDTGVGIEEANFNSIFETFKQLNEGLNKNYEGAGLGLAIAQKIANMAGGYINVESKLNIGSKFTILLPFQPKSV